MVHVLYPPFMKKSLILSILITLFLFTALPVSAKSNSDDHEHENSFSESFNRFVSDRKNDFNKFRHRDDHKKKNNDEHEDKCDGDNDEDDNDCVVSAPEFSSVTGPITFLVSSAAMFIVKKRSII